MPRSYSPALFSERFGSCRRKRPGPWGRLWPHHRQLLWRPSSAGSSVKRSGDTKETEAEGRVGGGWLATPNTHRALENPRDGDGFDTSTAGRTNTHSVLGQVLILFLFFIFIFFKVFSLFFQFLFIYLWLCWVFVSVRGLSLVVASGGHSSSWCAGLSLSRPLLLRSTGSRRAGSVIVAHGPSRSAVCGIFPDQGSNPCPLHWQADSQPLRHQGSPLGQVFEI